MRPGGIIGAVAGGILGALIWAAIAYFANFELGLVAWGIGIAVGMGSAMLGGEGGVNGLMCAFVALASIFGGKALAVKLTLGDGMEGMADVIFLGLQEGVVGIEGVDSKDYAQWMIDNEWGTEASKAEDITGEELEMFTDETVPMLEEIRGMSVDEWKASEAGQEVLGVFGDVEDSISIFSIVKENLGFMDILFAFLGVATAFRIGTVSDGEG